MMTLVKMYDTTRLNQSAYFNIWDTSCTIEVGITDQLIKRVDLAVSLYLIGCFIP